MLARLYNIAITCAVSSSFLSTNIVVIYKISDITHIIAAITIEYNANLWTESIMLDVENKLTIKSIPPKYNKYLYQLFKFNLLKIDISSTIPEKYTFMAFNPFKKSMPHFTSSMPRFKETDNYVQ